MYIDFVSIIYSTVELVLYFYSATDDLSLYNDFNGRIRVIMIRKEQTGRVIFSKEWGEIYVDTLLSKLSNTNKSNESLVVERSKV